MMAWWMIGPSQVKLSIGDEMKMKGTNKNGRTFASTAATNSREKWRCCAEECTNSYGDGRMINDVWNDNFLSWGIMPECFGQLGSCV
jgi:hypothetical protein